MRLSLVFALTTSIVLGCSRTHERSAPPGDATVDQPPAPAADTEVPIDGAGRIPDIRVVVETGAEDGASTIDGRPAVEDGGRSCETTLAALTCTSIADAWCCPATFDGRDLTLPPCYLGEERFTQTCGNRLGLVRTWGTHGIDCFYSLATGVLVAGVRGNDVPTYCNWTSSTESGGDPAQRNFCDPERLAPLLCPSDGGLSDAIIDATRP
jgi:hypothetical protein